MANNPSRCWPHAPYTVSNLQLPLLILNWIEWKNIEIILKSNLLWSTLKLHVLTARIVDIQTGGHFRVNIFQAYVNWIFFQVILNDNMKIDLIEIYVSFRNIITKEKHQTNKKTNNENWFVSYVTDCLPSNALVSRPSQNWYKIWATVRVWKKVHSKYVNKIQIGKYLHFSILYPVIDTG